MNTNKRKELIKDLAFKYKVDEKEVEKAVNAQFKFVKKHMESDKMPNIRLPFFGIFKVNKKKLKKIKQNIKNNE